MPDLYLRPLSGRLTLENIAKPELRHILTYRTKRYQLYLWLKLLMPQSGVKIFAQ